MRTVPARFDHIIYAFEETGQAETLKIEELQGKLKACEKKWLEHSNGKASDQVLASQTPRK